MPRQTQPKVTFYIDKNNRNKKGFAPIKANITVNYKNATKIIDHVLPSDWNPKQQRVRPPRPGKINDHNLINKILEELVTDFEAFTRRCKLNRIELTPEVAKKFLNGERSLTEKAFWMAYDEYSASKKVAPKTELHPYYNKLSEFEKET